MIKIYAMIVWFFMFSITFCSQQLEYQILRKCDDKYEVKIPTYSEKTGRAHLYVSILVAQQEYYKLSKFMEQSIQDRILFPIAMVGSDNGVKNIRIEWISLKQKQEKERIVVQQEKEWNDRSMKKFLRMLSSLK